jgi:hypothetical protein
VVIFTPVVDINSLRVNQPNSTYGTPGTPSVLAPSITAAYGGDPLTTVSTTSHNPIKAAAAGGLVGFPIRIWYSANDQLIPQADISAFVSAVNNNGGTASATESGSLDHTDAVAGVPTNDAIVQFMRANLSPT